MRLAAAALAGAAVGLAFPPWHWVWLLPLGVAGFAALLSGRREVLGARRGAALGFVFGLGFLGVLLPWLQVVSALAWPALTLVEALYLALLGAGWALVRRLPAAAAWQACLWVTVEAVRGAFPLGGFPWGRIAYAAIDTPAADLARFVGDGGVAFVVVLVSCLLGNAAGGWVSHRGSADAVGPAGAAWSLRVGALGRLVPAALLLVAVVAVPSPPATPVGAGGAVRVALVQGDTAGTGLAAMAERRAVLDNHVRATFRLAHDIRAGRRKRPALVVWPENSSDIDPTTDASAHAEIAAAVRAVGAPLLMGAVVEGPPGRWYNRAMVWSVQGAIGAHYDKQHAVPFGEYVPWRGLLAPLVPALDQIPEDMVPGRRPGLLRVGGVTAGVLMCFEVAYESEVRTLAGGGAGVIVVPTNNATYMGSGQVQQQFAISRIVAIETGRFVLVAATDGISGIVGPDGRVVSRAPVRTSRVLEQTVTTAHGETPAVRFGPWLDRTLWLLAAASLCAGLLVAYRRRAPARASDTGPRPAAPAEPDARPTAEDRHA